MPIAYNNQTLIKDILKRILGLKNMGMAAKHMEFAREDWLKVIEDKVPPKTVEINTKAFLVGYEK